MTLRLCDCQLEAVTTKLRWMLRKSLVVTQQMNPYAEAVLTTSLRSITQEVPVGIKKIVVC